MVDHISLRCLLILTFASGLLSFKLVHQRRMSEMNEEDQMLEDEDVTQVEENLDNNYFQGDILTTPEQMKKINKLLFHHTTNDVETPKTRGLIRNLSRTWPGARVYYEFSPLLAESRREMIRNAMKHWEQRTCLRFNERKTEPDYITFNSGFGCASYVGRIGGSQRLVVGQACRLGNVIHEIGHAIGMFHEMARPDRDEFVKILWKNIIRDRRRNFLKFSRNVINSLNVPYDYNSIMHYSRIHFTKDRGVGKETLVPKKDPTASIGQRIGLSELDIKQAKLLYKCDSNVNALNVLMPGH